MSIRLEEPSDREAFARVERAGSLALGVRLKLAWAAVSMVVTTRTWLSW